MLHGVLDHAGWIVFAVVLANQAGVPVFAMPVLLGVGALAASGDVGVGSTTAVAIGAAVGADLAWYGLGRWRGGWALAALRRFPGRTGAFVDHAQRLFLAYDRAFQVGARFLPELNPIAAAFAGAAHMKLRRFVVGSITSAAIWAGTWIGVGYVIGGAIRDGAASGLALLAAIAAAAAVGLLSIVLRPTIRATAVTWLSRRCGEGAPVANPRPVDVVVAAGACDAGRRETAVDMNEYTLEVLARDRMAELRAAAERLKWSRGVRPASRPLRIVLAHALIRMGRRLEGIRPPRGRPRLERTAP